MSNQGFLSRWSRRKVEVKTAPILEANIQIEDEQETNSVEIIADRPEEQISQEDQDAILKDLPDVETLTAESDFTSFLKKGVPEELKKIALRKLWRSNPIFANLDGLNDYDEDFTKITPLAAGVADELLKLMKENARHEVEEEEEEEDTEEDLFEAPEEDFITPIDEDDKGESSSSDAQSSSHS